MTQPFAGKGLGHFSRTMTKRLAPWRLTSIECDNNRRKLEWRFDRHLTAIAIYNCFFAGDFIKETGLSRNIDFVGGSFGAVLPPR